MKYKAALLSLGCKVNSYETEKIRESMVEKGFEIVDFSEIADVYIVNTCSVTNIADRKSRQMLHRAKSLNPDAIIVATGCYVQTEKDKDKLDEVSDILIGNNHKGDIADIVLEYFQNNHFTEYLDDISKEKQVESFSINDYPERSRAFVRIEDGCNQFCSYCIIPYARGRVRSKNEDDILKEVRDLADKGFKEIVLTGIHISSYGLENYEKYMKGKTDLSQTSDKNVIFTPHQSALLTDSLQGGVIDEQYEVSDFDGVPLLNLIRKISKISGIERIRLGSLEPRIITKEFAEQLKSVPSVCPHFHLSLQSGCDTVLKRMNRHYTMQEFLGKCEILRTTFNRPAITTDVIVGFPGETEEEFEESLGKCREAAFAKMHIFKYSRRKGTVADRMPGQLTEKVKHERSLRLQTLDDDMKARYNSLFVGETVKILVEEIKDGKAIGLTERYVQVEADPGSVEYIGCDSADRIGTNNDGTSEILLNKINEFVYVKVTKVLEDGILHGIIV